MNCIQSCKIILQCIAVGILVITFTESHSISQKRVPNFLHEFTLRRLPRAYLNRIMQRARERRAHLSDVGYGSRVAAGSNVASAIMARHGLFGITGPGRRKRLFTPKEDRLPVLNNRFDNDRYSIPVLDTFQSYTD